VPAFDGDTRIGVVNVAWDGDDHAFIPDTAVRQWVWSTSPKLGLALAPPHS
jgi:hypothetical protein